MGIDKEILKKYTQKYTLELMKKSKKKYSISFYTGGVDVDKWADLTAKQKKDALAKSWYIRWTLLNPKTNRLERKQNIKGGVNRFKSKFNRLEFLKVMKIGLIESIEKKLQEENLETQEETFDFSYKFYSVKEALKLAHEHSKLTTANTTSNDYFYAKEQFLSFIGSENQDIDIKKVNKSMVLKFLNHKLKETSARTRNNSKSSLSALFTILETKLNIIDKNFIKEIPNEKVKEKTDRTFTKKELTEIVKWLKENDPYLLLYIKFVAYNHLRPVEVNRLRVKDINLEEGLVYFKAKNKPLKTKRIPSIYINELKKLKLHRYNKEFYLFTPNNKPSFWDTDDNTRRDYFSKRFKKVKDIFRLGVEYGLYSFRHSFITNLFRYLRTQENKSYSQAIEILQPITGHETRVALEKYIHAIDADIPEDWSDKIDFIL